MLLGTESSLYCCVHSTEPRFSLHVSYRHVSNSSEYALLAVAFPSRSASLRLVYRTLSHTPIARTLSSIEENTIPSRDSERVDLVSVPVFVSSLKQTLPFLLIPITYPPQLLS